jgi:hypothetical protein
MSAPPLRAVAAAFAAMASGARDLDLQRCGLCDADAERLFGVLSESATVTSVDLSCAPPRVRRDAIPHCFAVRRACVGSRATIFALRFAGAQPCGVYVSRVHRAHALSRCPRAWLGRVAQSTASG